MDQEFNGLETFSIFKRDDGPDIQVQKRGIEELTPGRLYYLRPDWREAYVFELGGPLIKAPSGLV